MSSELAPLNPKNEIGGIITVVDDVATELVRFSPESNSFFDKLFPDQKTKAKNLHEVSLAKTEYEFRERALACARNAQLQAIQDMYNDYMVRGKANIRRERAEFFLNQFNSLQDAIRKECEAFEKATQKAWEDAEKIPVPLLKQKKIDLINQSINDFYKIVDKLKKDFENILNENVKA